MIFFDLETTGLDPETDRIIQFYAVTHDGHELHFLCNPQKPISADAEKAHGIADDDLVGRPTFKYYSDDVQTLFTPDQTIVGYNSRVFDTPLLHNELIRVGQPGLLTDAATGAITQPEIDLLKVWRLLEPRNLAGAARRFGVALPEVLHDARVDTSLLPMIMRGMASTLATDNEMMRRLTCNGEIDRAGKFKLDDQGVAVFAFGKHVNKPASSEPGYLRWMLDANFATSTKAAIRKIMLEEGISL